MSRLSVVIPTHNRESRLAFALDSLAGQTLAGDDELDVVVVRGRGAREPLVDAPQGLSVRFLFSDQLGPAPQRNVGWRAANAPLVAFLDDDCRVAPGWAEAVLAAYDSRTAQESLSSVIVQGRTEPDPDELHLLFGLARTIEVTGPTGLYETCNLVYPRALLERLNGFDEGFRLPHWGEDTDLGLRAEDAGAELAYADRAVAWHAVHPNPLPHAIREAGRRRRFARLLALHPRLRGSLIGGIFVNQAHLWVTFAATAAVGGILTPRSRRTVIVAGLVPYVARGLIGLAADGRVTPRRAARFAVHLPARAAVDAAETLATARGAIEERTLVL